MGKALLLEDVRLLNENSSATGGLPPELLAKKSPWFSLDSDVTLCCWTQEAQAGVVLYDISFVF